MQQPTLPYAHSDFFPSQTSPTTGRLLLSLFRRPSSHSFTFHFRGFVFNAVYISPTGSPLNYVRLASNATTLKRFFGCVGRRVGYLPYFLKRRTFTQGLLAVPHPLTMSSSDDDMPLACGIKSNGLSNGVNGTFPLSFFWLLSLFLYLFPLPKHVEVNVMPRKFCLCLSLDSDPFTFTSSN